MGDTVKSSAKTWCAARVQFPPPPLLFFPRVHLTNFCTSHDSGQPAWAAPPRPTARTRIALTTPRAVALAISRVACLGGRGNPVSHYPPLGSLSPQPAPHARGGGACFGQRDYETGWWGEGGGGFHGQITRKVGIWTRRVRPLRIWELPPLAVGSVSNRWMDWAAVARQVAKFHTHGWTSLVDFTRHGHCFFSFNMRGFLEIGSGDDDASRVLTSSPQLRKNKNVFFDILDCV